MIATMQNIPLSLYIHYPRCLKKCDYCDFYSSTAPISDEAFVNAILDSLTSYLPYIDNREIHSLFFGGGTPSLLSPDSIKRLLNRLATYITIKPDAEITLEANPETLSQSTLSGFKNAGINRLSIGCQSFQNSLLEALGRIHDREKSISAIKIAQDVGFNNINLDLMFSLPNQTVEAALNDLKNAIDLSPQHISWYELTIEPNTPFGHHPPSVPDEEIVEKIQNAGKKMLAENGFIQYETSAYARSGFQCQHNLNYWEFGDYIGLGQGAHGKMTTEAGKIIRFNEHGDISICSAEETVTDFMLNALRLTKGFDLTLFETRTCLSKALILDNLNQAKKQGFLTIQQDHVQPTPLGQQYLNECLQLF